jgi:predicted amidohydrolase
MQQMARNVTMEGCGALRDCRYLLHDRDTKYTESFRAIIASGRVEPLVLPARSPNLNAYAERWVRLMERRAGRQALPRSSMTQGLSDTRPSPRPPHYASRTHESYKGSRQPSYDQRCFIGDLRSAAGYGSSIRPGQIRVCSPGGARDMIAAASHRRELLEHLRLSFPKIISGRSSGAARTRLGWRQWHRSAGPPEAD